MGETISAIANSCLLEGKEYGYILIGVKDKVWEVVGTSKKLSNFHVKGGQDIELYLKTMLTPEINFYFFDEIQAAAHWELYVRLRQYYQHWEY